MNERILAPTLDKEIIEVQTLYDELRAFGVKVSRGKETMEALAGHDDLVDSLWLANIAAQQGYRKPAMAITQN